MRFACAKCPCGIFSLRICSKLFLYKQRIDRWCWYFNSSIYRL